MNQVLLVGRLTKDIEVRYTQQNLATAKFTLAVNRKFKKDESDFINCQAWGKTAELLEKYVGKGSRIGVIGEIRTGSYEKNGQKVYTTDVNVENVDIIDFKDSGTGYKEEQKVAHQAPVQEDFAEIEDDTDLPF